MPRVNAPARASNQPIALLRGSQPEMRTLAPETETVFPAELTKEPAFRSETAKDSE
jgi:hypothetical protein